MTEPEGLREFAVFPNPAGGYAMARMRLAEPAWISLSLFDARGSMVQSWPGAISGAYDLRIDMSAQPPGVYLIVLHTDRAVAIRKVVKE